MSHFAKRSLEQGESLPDEIVKRHRNSRFESSQFRPILPKIEICPRSFESSSEPKEYIPPILSVPIVTLRPRRENPDPGIELNKLEPGQAWWAPQRAVSDSDIPSGILSIKTHLVISRRAKVAKMDNGYFPQDEQNELVMGLKLDVGAWPDLKTKWMQKKDRLKIIYIYIFYRPNISIPDGNIVVFNPKSKRIESYLKTDVGLCAGMFQEPIIRSEDIGSAELLHIPVLTEGKFDPGMTYW